MLCRVCQGDKLSNEFIPYSITEKCSHPKLICLRCATKAAETGKCPYTACDQPIPKESYQIKEFQLMLHYLFEEVHDIATPDAKTDGELNQIRIDMLTGESISLDVSMKETIVTLKRKIYAQLRIEVGRQKLLYNDRELTDTSHDRVARLKDFGVKQNSTINLMVLLYAVPSRLDHVTFDLFWGYPSRKRDYLDATCLIFSGEQFVREVDYVHVTFSVQQTRSNDKTNVRAIYHSGDVMDDENKIGHHTIEVYLKNIPPYITHLFFTLSSWNSPTIKYYKRPSLRFHKSSDPKNDLCKTSFTHANSSQAVVMCSVSRQGDSWNIYDSGKLSDGNAKNYIPLIDTIEGLIKSGI